MSCPKSLIGHPELIENTGFRLKDCRNDRQTNRVYKQTLSSGDSLKEIANNQFDFVIGNHILEHFLNPIKGLVEWFRVVKEEGFIFLSVPNYKSNEYDFQRKPPTIKNLIKIYSQKDEQFLRNIKYKCYSEFVEFGSFYQKGTDEFNNELKHFLKTDYRPHFFVYNLKLIRDILNYLKTNLGIYYEEVCEFSFDKSWETILILCKGKLNKKVPLMNNLNNNEKLEIIKQIIRKCDVSDYIDVQISSEKKSKGISAQRRGKVSKITLSWKAFRRILCKPLYLRWK